MTGSHIRVGHVAQDDNLLPWRTTVSNVELALEIKGVPRREAARAGDRTTLSASASAASSNHYPHQLSGGMRKRASIVRTLIDETTDVILMDEPFGPLDAQTRLVLQDELLRLWQDTGRTIVFVTHDIVEAVALSDRIAIFTAAPGTIKAVYDADLPRPRDVFHIHEMPGFSPIYDRIWHDLREELDGCEAAMPAHEAFARPSSLELREASLLAGAAAGDRRARRNRLLRTLALQAAVLALLLVGWQVASGRWIDSLFLSDPISVIEAFIRIVADGSLWRHLQVTLVEMVLGYVVGVVAGVGAAFVLLAIPFGRPIAQPVMMMAFATPKVALAPLIIIWFGINLLPKAYPRRRARVLRDLFQYPRRHRGDEHGSSYPRCA